MLEMHQEQQSGQRRCTVERLQEFDRYIIAGRDDTSEDMLIQLAFDNCENVRRHAAENPHTPVDILIPLAGDPSPEVRICVGENPHTPQTILKMLALDDNLDVRMGLAEDHQTPEPVLKMLAEDSNPYVAQRAWLTLNQTAHQGARDQERSDAVVWDLSAL